MRIPTLPTICSTLLLLPSLTVADRKITSHAKAALQARRSENKHGQTHSRSLPGEKDVSIQMFQWSYDAIAAECPNISKLGYGWVQVNPVNEHIQGDSWWTDYQSVSYKIGSKHGTKAQFQNMIEKCHAVGVGIILDSLWNHMSGQDGPGVGILGSNFSHYDYPGIYNTNDFHHCTNTPNSDIQNWYDRQECQTCELFNLADLATESEKVRATLANFLNEVLDMGVDGFRIDAAKHIAVTDIQNIVSRLKGTKSGKPIYFTQEVTYEGGGGPTSAEYTVVGEVEEFRYPTALLNAFGSSGSLGSLLGIGNSWLPTASANVFVTNHDRERGGALSYRASDNQYVLAHVFMLAYHYGSPTVLSSYTITNNDAGPPDQGAGKCSGHEVTGGWQCQHTWYPIAGMVGFRNVVKGLTVDGWTQPTKDTLSFFRGNAGFVAINKGALWKYQVKWNRLPAGKYCDVITGGLSADEQTCIGTMWEIPATGDPPVLEVPKNGAVAFHINAKIVPKAIPVPVVLPHTVGLGSVPIISINFQVNAPTVYGESIVVVGGIPKFGNWDPTRGFALSADGYTAEKPIWKGTIQGVKNWDKFEYKFVKISQEAPVWESTVNRVMTKSKTPTVDVTAAWNQL